ncbi:MAG TPA: hypothetical protein VMW30_07050 [Candidatus Paceibacterota bacterium]|nr:hypothetical protein [Candidatus Paceibacterota bacterium]
MSDRTGEVSEWEVCLDTLVQFDPYLDFTPPYSEPDVFVLELQGLIRPTMACARAGLILFRAGEFATADIVTRSALEHALYAQFFYLHKDEPNLIHKKFLMELERFLRNTVNETNFTTDYTSDVQSATLTELDSVREKLRLLTVSIALPSDSTVGDHLVMGRPDQSSYFKMLYRLLSQTVHPAGGVASYIGFQGEDPITVLRDSQTVTPEVSLHFLAACCVWVLAIQESLVKTNSKLEALCEIATKYNIEPWMRLL